MKNEVVLVDEQDNETGVMDKTEVHLKGLLHRAFSVFIFNSKNELLLQQRASSKYHSGDLWSNTCCSHPHPGEDLKTAAEKRLLEEMGISCELHPVFTFIYKAQLDDGFTEHEYDHVYFGYSDQIPQPDKSEVQGWKYLSMQELSKDIKENPAKYTAWLKLCFDKVISATKK